MAATASVIQDQLTGSGTVDTLYTASVTNKAGVSVMFINLTGDDTTLTVYVNGDAEADQITDAMTLVAGDQTTISGILGDGDDIRAASSSADTPVNVILTALED